MKTPSLEFLSLQITQLCNFRCIMCSFQKNYNHNRPPHMNLDLIKKVVKQYQSREKSVNKFILLSAGAEPLMHPEFTEVCDLLNRFQMPFGFDTNGSLLDQIVSNSLLLNPFFKRIVFSVDGFTSSTFEKIRNNSNFLTVKENILNFLSLKETLSRNDIHTRINIVEQELNKKEIPNIIDYWYNKVDKIHVSTLRKGFHVKEVHWKPSERIPCDFLWKYLRILTDGTVVCCCIDECFSLKIGNIKNANIFQIWNGDHINELRNMHCSKNWSCINICSSCNAWAGFLPPQSMKPFADDIEHGYKPTTVVYQKKT